MDKFEHPFDHLKPVVTDAEVEIVSMLIKYYRGELSPEHEAKVSEHLSTCERCAQEYEEVKEFLEFKPEPLDPAESERLEKIIMDVYNNYIAKNN